MKTRLLAVVAVAVGATFPMAGTNVASAQTLNETVSYIQEKYEDCKSVHSGSNPLRASSARRFALPSLRSIVEPSPSPDGAMP